MINSEYLEKLNKFQKKLFYFRTTFNCCGAGSENKVLTSELQIAKNLHFQTKYWVTFTNKVAEMQNRSSILKEAVGYPGLNISLICAKIKKTCKAVNLTQSFTIRSRRSAKIN